MYSHIEIKNLRGIASLQGAGFKRINLLVGLNNAGKTTVLEALFLLGGATNPVFATTLGQLRGQRLGKTSPDAVWRPLFKDLDPRTPVELAAGVVNEAGSRELRIEAVSASRFADTLVSGGIGGGMASVTQDFVIGGLALHYTSSAGKQIITKAIFDPRTGNVDAPSSERPDFIATTLLSARNYSSLEHDAQQFSRLLKLKRDQDVLDAVQLIDGRVQRIEIVSESGGPAVYVDIGLPALVPLAVCGEGFVRLFSLVVELTASRGGVLLVDEIDNGLHYSVMEKLWLYLGDLAEKYDVQIFATTHNEDIIRTALAAQNVKTSDELRLFRLDYHNGKHKLTSYDAEEMQAVLREHFEVRG